MPRFGAFREARMRLVKFIKPYVLQLIAYLKKHYEIQKPRVIAGLRFL